MGRRIQGEAASSPDARGVTRILLFIVTAVVIGPACGPTHAPRAEVRWRACDFGVAGARCGELDVAEDRRRPGSRTIALSFIVLPALQSERTAEPVWALSGGPGDGSTTLLPAVTRAWQAVRERRDIVLVDQRGTGSAHPLQCESTIDQNPSAAFGHVFDPAVIEACRAALAPIADLAAYTTAASVDDLDEVRQALGYDRLVLWGGSYGSRLALSYMERHPERVTFAVLDSVAPPEVSVTSQYAKALQGAIDRTIAHCRERRVCRNAHPSLAQDLDRMAQRLRRSRASTFVRLPTGAPVPVTVGLGDVAYAIRGILYSTTGHDELPALIHGAAARDGFQPFAQRYWQRAVRLRASHALGLHLSVMCSEDVPADSDEAADRLSEGTLLGRYLVDEYRRACRAWGVTPANAAAGGRPPSPLAISTLLLSGRFDPVTPPDYADQIAARLPQARHDIAAAAGHGVTFGCARDAVAQVLAAGTLTGVPPMCTAPAVRR